MDIKLYWHDQHTAFAEFPTPQQGALFAYPAKDAYLRCLNHPFVKLEAAANIGENSTCVKSREC